MIERPDPHLLQAYADYELWTHDDNCPITAQQLGECVVIGSSIDGDFLSIHPQVEGLLWLPTSKPWISLRHPYKHWLSGLNSILPQTYGLKMSISAWLFFIL
ncbi:hypothetical protein [Paenibacillus sp. MZ03-122A]|uniref:hypothetical protein n=1 Tax=Paenibacillus sp. MZ03-122A TaxID=2962033 RepID=UPI0020B8DD6C|nr:hypothetical protein [Paenibacillus sp. MZ03-122A]MCP3777963.1 hypothetical protein [Paenibacillus sp. MZ03-122A]